MPPPKTFSSAPSLPTDTLDVELDGPVARACLEPSPIAFIRRGLVLKAGREVAMRRLSSLVRDGKIVHDRFTLPTP